MYETQRLLYESNSSRRRLPNESDGRQRRLPNKRDVRQRRLPNERNGKEGEPGTAACGASRNAYCSRGCFGAVRGGV